MLTVCVTGSYSPTTYLKRKEKDGKENKRVGEKKGKKGREGGREDIYRDGLMIYIKSVQIPKIAGS
jgi:hypothetical protein